MCEPQKKQISSEEQTKAEAQKAEAPQTNITSTNPSLARTLEYLQDRQNSMARYTDKLSKALYEIVKAVDNLNLSVDLNYIDTEEFCIHRKDEFTIEKGYLQIRNGLLRTHYVTLDEGFNYEKTESWIFNSISRAERKAIITSGRLPIFLSNVAEEMRKTTEEYKTVANIAEKMAASIRDNKIYMLQDIADFVVENPEMFKTDETQRSETINDQ